ncbi:hypothetical protein [Alkaliphilus metalliredigens]|uniref:hypothetical protein n=1 Tax=Alkaliphilus metalliredigens TaxID=208226 RepID=UPI0002E9B7A3|nr:hypothetical protein [Alkaliphilus metalliredigens]
MFNHIIGIVFLTLLLIPIGIILFAFVNKTLEDIRPVARTRKPKPVPVYNLYKRNDHIASEYASKNIRIVK